MLSRRLGAGIGIFALGSTQACAAEWPKILLHPVQKLVGNFSVECSYLFSDPTPSITSKSPSVSLNEKSGAYVQTGVLNSSPNHFWAQSHRVSSLKNKAGVGVPFEDVVVYETGRPLVFFQRDESGKMKIKPTGWVFFDARSDFSIAEPFGWSEFKTSPQVVSTEWSEILKPFQIESVQTKGEKKIWTAKSAPYTLTVSTDLTEAKLLSVKFSYSVNGESLNRETTYTAWAPMELGQIPIAGSSTYKLVLTTQPGSSPMKQESLAKFKIEHLELETADNPIPWTEGMVFHEQKGDGPQRTLRRVNGEYIEITDPGNEAAEPKNKPSPAPYFTVGGLVLAGAAYWFLRNKGTKPA